MHPDVALSLACLGEILFDRGEHDATHDAYAEAAAIYAERVDDDHPSYAACRQALAVIAAR